MPLILASAVFFNCSRVKAPVDPFWTAVKSLLELVVIVILASMHASSSAVGSNITVSPTLAACYGYRYCGKWWFLDIS